MSSVREITEGVQEQGVEEEWYYTLTIPATWGTPTGTPTVKGYSYIAGEYTDVTSTIFPSGSASVDGQVITLPLCKAMTEDVRYRVEILGVTLEGNKFEVYAWIDCKR